MYRQSYGSGRPTPLFTSSQSISGGGVTGSPRSSSNRSTRGFTSPPKLPTGTNHSRQSQKPCRKPPTSYSTLPLEQGDSQRQPPPIPGDIHPTDIQPLSPRSRSEGLEPLHDRHDSNHSSHRISAVLWHPSLQTKASTPACFQGPVLSAPLLRGEGKFGHQSPNRPTNTWPVPRQASQLPGLCRGAAIMAL